MFLINKYGVAMEILDIPPAPSGIYAAKYDFKALKARGGKVHVPISGDKAVWQRTRSAAHRYATYNGFRVAVRKVEGGLDVYYAGTI